MNTKHLIIGGFLAAATAVSAPASAQTRPNTGPAVAAAAEEPTWKFGGKLGLLMAGEATIETDAFSQDIGTESGLTLMVNADAVVAPRLTVGGFGLYASSETEGGGGFSITTLGGTIKARFASGSLEFRPGIAIGIQRVAAEASDGDDSTGLDLGGFLEVAYAPETSSFEWLGEVGFISQPSGGGDEYYLTFGPIFYVSAGIGFGR